MAVRNRMLFIERNDFSLRIGRVVDGGSGLVIEEVAEREVEGPEQARVFVQEFTRERAGNLVRAYCAVYPRNRILRDYQPKDGVKAAGAAEMVERASIEFGIDGATHRTVVLSAASGIRFESGGERHFLVCSAPRQELQDEQDFLVKAGIYPLRLEIGSIATIGLLVKLQKAVGAVNPVLLLEVGEERSHFLVVSQQRLEFATSIPVGLGSIVAGVRRELRLKDEVAAKRLFYSDSFDFREMGERLVADYLRELQTMAGFYEHQTGQSIGRIYCGLLPGKLDWISGSLALGLGIERLDPVLPEFFEAARLSVRGMDVGHPLLMPQGLLGLMVNQEVGE